MREANLGGMESPDLEGIEGVGTGEGEVSEVWIVKVQHFFQPLMS